MGELQRFRTELVEWLKEIVPFNRLDQYTSKTREGYLDDPEASRHDNYVNYIICTDKHRYSISATPWYLGCIASTMFYRPGENWTRGNDLPDGPFNYETWLNIKNAILRYELVKLVETRVGAVSEPQGPDASKVPDPTPEEKEYLEANGELYRAKERFEHAERALNGQNNREAIILPSAIVQQPDVLPFLNRTKIAAHHPAENVG